MVKPLHHAQAGRRGWPHYAGRPVGTARARLGYHCRQVLSLITGPASTLTFEIRDAACSEGSGHSSYEVRQLLDLSGLSSAAPATLRIQSASSACPTYFERTPGFFVFDEYRFILIRFGAILLPVDTPLAELFKIDQQGFYDARGLPVAPGGFCLIRMHGHGGSGSIQLVSRPLAERLVQAYPNLYSF